MTENLLQRCQECGASEPLYRADDVECEVCAVIDDLANLRGQLTEALEEEEYDAARNELEALGKTIDIAAGHLDSIDEPRRYNILVDHLNPAVGDHNSAITEIERQDRDQEAGHA